MFSTRFRTGVSIAVCMSTLSCGDGPTEVQTGEPAAILIIDGDEQEGIVNRELNAPLVVRVVDGDGNSLSGQLVNFAVTSGDGKLYSGSALTSAEGLVQERWTLGTSTSDTQHVEARVLNSSKGEALFTTFVATALPDAPQSVNGIGEESFNGVVGEALPDSLAVVVLDQFGNPVPGVGVEWSVLAGEGAITSRSTITGPDGLSRALWTLGTEVGDHRASAAVETLGSVTFHAFAAPGEVAEVSVLPGSADLVSLGETIQLIAAASDQYGNPVPTSSITWTSKDPTVADVNDTGLVEARGNGSTTVSATSGGGTGEAVITVEQEVVLLDLSATRDTIEAVGDTLPIKVRVEDRYGNAVSNVEALLTSSDTSVLAITHGKPVSAGNGTALLIASAGGVADTLTVKVVQVAVGVIVEPAEQTVRVDESSYFRVRAIDRNRNAIPDVQMVWMVDWWESCTTVGLSDSEDHVQVSCSQPGIFRSNFHTYQELGRDDIWGEAVLQVIP